MSYTDSDGRWIRETDEEELERKLREVQKKAELYNEERAQRLVRSRDHRSKVALIWMTVVMIAGGISVTASMSYITGSWVSKFCGGGSGIAMGVLAGTVVAVANFLGLAWLCVRFSGKVDRYKE